MPIDTERFEIAKSIIYAPGAPAIGTLGEKTTHAVLKDYYCTPGAQKEVKIGAHYADIVDGSAIIEIQTRGFDKLRGKLDALLPEYQVRIVYPLPSVKWLAWIDGESGVVTKKRRSPKRGTPFSAFAELYKIKMYLKHPNLSLCIAMLDMEEYRNLNGWSADRKRGSSRHDRIPVALVDEIIIESAADWRKLIPQALEAQFTARDFETAAKISLSNARTALNVLTYVEAVERVGKQGNAIIYQYLLER